MIRQWMQADPPLHNSIYTVTASTAQLDIALVDETYGTVGVSEESVLGRLYPSSRGGNGDFQSIVGTAWGTNIDVNLA